MKRCWIQGPPDAKDVGTGRARMASSLMTEIGLIAGDVVEIHCSPPYVAPSSTSSASNRIDSNALIEKGSRKFLCTVFPLKDIGSDEVLWKERTIFADLSIERTSFASSSLPLSPSTVLPILFPCQATLAKPKEITLPAASHSYESSPPIPDALSIILTPLSSSSSSSVQLFKSSLLNRPIGPGCVISLPSSPSSSILIPTAFIDRVQPTSSLVFVRQSTFVRFQDPRSASTPIAPGKASSSLMPPISSVKLPSWSSLGLGGDTSAADSIFQLLEARKLLRLHYSQKRPQGSNHKIESLLQYCCPSGLLIRGPPGCGKTLSARTACKRTEHIHLIEVTAADLATSLRGGSEAALRASFEEAKSIQDSNLNVVVVILLRQLEIVCPRREARPSSSSSGSGSQAGTRLVAQLLTLLDGFNSSEDAASQQVKPLVVATVQDPNELDPALRRPGRFDREVELSPPNADERASILHAISPYKDVVDPVWTEMIKTISQRTPGYTGTDLSSFYSAACLQSVQKGRSPSSLLPFDISDAQEALRMVPASSLRNVAALTALNPHASSSGSSGASMVAGLDSVQSLLERAIEWPLVHPQRLKAMGVKPPRGVLLYGPPGCAKSTIVRALALRHGLTLLTLDAASLYSAYVGAAEASIRDIFARGRRLTPCVVFIDEIDTLVGNRDAGPGGSGVSERVLSTLLNEMDGVEHTPVTLVAATNRPEMIDSALLRPGRLDHLVYVPPPESDDARVKIFRMHTAGRGTPLAVDVDLNRLAEMARDGFTGADIAGICTEAAMAALRECVSSMEECVVKQCHLEEALKRAKPTVTPLMKLAYESFAAKHSKR